VTTAWNLLIGEARAGVRRWPGTDVGERYAQHIAYAGSPDHADPLSVERTLGDLLDPTRPTRVLDLVNAVSREVGRDVAGWNLGRVWSLYGQMEREARERERESGDV